MAVANVSPLPGHPQPLAERDYRGTLPPELRGEVLAWNLMAACTYWPHMERVISKLTALLAAADALRTTATQPSTEAAQPGVQWQ